MANVLSSRIGGSSNPNSPFSASLTSPDGPRSDSRPSATTMGGRMNGIVIAASSTPRPRKRYLANTYADGRPNSSAKIVESAACHTVNTNRPLRYGSLAASTNGVRMPCPSHPRPMRMTLKSGQAKATARKPSGNRIRPPAPEGALHTPYPPRPPFHPRRACYSRPHVIPGAAGNLGALLRRQCRHFSGHPPRAADDAIDLHHQFLRLSQRPAHLHVVAHIIGR